DRAQLLDSRRRWRRLDERRYESAVHLQGFLRRAQSACRRQSNDRRRVAQGRGGVFAGAVQARVARQNPSLLPLVVPNPAPEDARHCGTRRTDFRFMRWNNHECSRWRSAMSTSSIARAGLIVVAMCLPYGAVAAVSSPFAAMAGTWSGSGTLT